MSYPLKAICGKKRFRQDGTSVIFIQYCFSSTHRTLLNTGIIIPPQCWDKRNHCISKNLPKGYGDANDLNEKLKKLIRIAEDLIDFAHNKKIANKGDFVKKTFHPDFDRLNLQIEENSQKILEENKIRDDSLDLYAQIDDYIKSKEKRVVKGTLDVYNSVKEQLRAFEIFRKEKITFESFDYSFYMDFIDFLTFDYVQKRKKLIKGLKVNTIGKTIKQLRIFIRDRIKRKIIRIRPGKYRLSVLAIFKALRVKFVQFRYLNIHDILKHMLQPLVGIHFMFLADGKERIDTGSPACGIM